MLVIEHEWVKNYVNIGNYSDNYLMASETCVARASLLVFLNAKNNLLVQYVSSYF